MVYKYMLNMKSRLNLKMVALVFALVTAGVVMPASADSIDEVDSLLTVYDESKSSPDVGRRLLNLYAEDAVFFDEPPIMQTDNREEQDLTVWYGAERFFVTNAYFAEAFEYIERALPLAEKLAATDAAKKDIYATLLCDKCYCLFKTSQYEEAIETGQQTIKLSQETGNTMQLSRAYLYISLVNHALRNYDEAVTLVEKAIATTEQLGDSMQLHNTLGVACEIFCSAKQLDKAVSFGERAVKTAREVGFEPGVANHLMQLSYAYDRRGDYQKGLDMANEAIAITKRQEPIDRNLLALCLEYKGWNLLDMKRNREAAEAIREAMRLETEVGNTHAVYWNWRTLSEALEPIDPHAAIDALKNYTKMGDSIHSEQLKQLMSQANAEVRNDELQEENVESRRLNRIILWTSVVVVLLLVAVIASLGFAFRQKKRLAQALQQLALDRETFFTNVTHELRTPLTVILGLSGEMQKSHTAPTWAQEALAAFTTIERQGQQLLTLVNQMLDFAKVKSALNAPATTQGDLSAYVGMIVETHRE